MAVGWFVDRKVISVLRRHSPDANVQSWCAQRPAAELYLSVLTLGELRERVEVRLIKAGAPCCVSGWSGNCPCSSQNGCCRLMPA